MGDEEDFKAEGFSQFTETEGSKTVNVMDETKEFQFKAKCFINKAATIGYAEVAMEGAVETAFISKTGRGAVLTLTGEQTGRLPLKIEGLYTIMSILKDTPLATIYVEHKKAFDGQSPIKDEEWVKVETANLPKTAIDVGMAFIKQFMEAFDGLAQQMGEVVGEIGKGLGEAVGQAFEGIGEAMQQAPTDDTLSEVDIMPAHELGIKEPKPKSGPKKKAPAKKASTPKKKRASTKKATPPIKKKARVKTKGKSAPKKKKK